MGVIRTMKRAAARNKKGKPKDFYPLLATPGKHPLFDLAAIMSGKPPRSPPVKLRLPKNYSPMLVAKSARSFPVKSRSPIRSTTSRQVPVVRPNKPRAPGPKSRNSSFNKKH